VLGRVFAVSFNYSMVRSSVFYTRQQHKTVLPKYLLLVLASGTASYGGIRLLSATFGITPVSAKLVVETVLFFVNFAVQRLFIFKPDGAAAAPAEPRPARAVPARLVSTVVVRSEEHTSELQSLTNLVCRLLLEKKKKCTKDWSAQLFEMFMMSL